MFSRTDDIVERDENVIGSVLKIRQFPLVAESASGCRITDPEGKEYIDFTASWAVANTGYCHPAIIRSVTEQLQKNSFASFTSILSEPTVCLAEEMIRRMPGEFDKKVFFGLSGSDANDCITKMLPLATNRPRLISYFGAYHGQTMGSLAVSGHTAQAKFIGGGHVVKIPYPYCYRCAFGMKSETCNFHCIDFIEDHVFASICPPEDVGGILAEAIQCDGGDIVPPKDYFKRLKNLCEKYGILLVMDEVKIGIGRTGKFFGFEHFDVEPDAIVFGKPIASGMPLSGVIARSYILDSIIAGHLFTTAGNPVSAAAGIATLNVIDEENLIKKAHESGVYFLDQLGELKKRYELIGDVRGKGLVIGIELVKDRLKKNPASKEAAKICFRAYQKGLAVFYVGLHSNVLEITPPLIISRKEIDQGLEILEESINDVLAGKISDEAIAKFAGW